ncbi:hypothetical protein ACQ4T2_25585, partial [Escherichia coli]|uniref:hypothetical protein n=1 Tax=Escherichia coli TaxID=562 RepID=UPI003D312DEC
REKGYTLAAVLHDLNQASQILLLDEPTRGRPGMYTETRCEYVRSVSIRLMLARSARNWS